MVPSRRSSTCGGQDLPASGMFGIAERQHQVHVGRDAPGGGVDGHPGHVGNHVLHAPRGRRRDHGGELGVREIAHQVRHVLLGLEVGRGEIEHGATVTRTQV